MLFWALLCLNLSVSKAEVVTVPIGNGLSVTVTTGETQLQNLNTNPLATNVTMGDDSNVNVPLGFNFPYFGQTFNNSWMYSNGGVSFTGPNIPSGYCCSGINLTTLNNSAYNYSIVPLWTDLIAIEGGSHFKLGTSNSMTYGWYSVSEFYDPSKRSSFEVKIDDTGLVDVRFTGALVSHHTVTSGLIGDINKGEYYQYYYGNGFNSGPFSFVLNSNYTPPPLYPPQCDTNPLYSTQCPGYAEALARSIANSSTTNVTSIDSLAAPSSIPGVIEAATTSIEQVAIINPLPLPTTSVSPTTQTTNTTLTPAAAASEERSKPQASSSLISSILRNNQLNLQSVEKNAVERAIKDADTLTNASIKEAELISESSTTSSILSSTMSSTLAAQSSSSSLFNTSRGESASRQQVEQEVIKNEAFNPVGRSVINDYLNTSPIIDGQDKAENKKIITKSTPPNELAVGVSIADMQKLPIGFDVYTVSLQDSKFYAPKEIYKNQKVIDNQRVLRQFNARSDRLHEEMVNGQFLK